jgi:hypothetical protein
VLANDYKPYEVPEFAEPCQEDINIFLKDKTVVSEKIF